MPDQPLLTSGRFYAEISADGLTNTGLAIANPNNSVATVVFTVRDANGVTVKSGVATIGANQQRARFLDQDPYLVSPGLQGSFSFVSSVPIGVIALRGYLNERTPREFLTTTLPVLNLTSSVSIGTQVIPHFAAGDGWTTYVVLVNPTDVDQTGSIQFLTAGSATAAGALQSVVIDGGLASSATYIVKANSSKRFVVTSASPGTLSGSVRIVPAAGGSAPTPLAIFSYKSQGITVSEAGVPVLMGNAFRLFAQLSPSQAIRTGVAISNATNLPGTVALSLTDLNGSVLATAPNLALPASGQIVGFLDELIPSLAGQTVQGVLRISSANISSISVVGLRLRINQRQDALITTTPPTDENGPFSSEDRVFPQVVNGEGWTTQFILISPTSSGTPAQQTYQGTLNFGAVDGTPLNLNIN